MDFVTVSTGLILPYWMGLPIRYIHIIEEPIEYKKKFSLVKQNLDRNLTFKKLTSVIIKISHLKQTIG